MTSFFKIRKGIVAVSRALDDGRRQIVAVRAPGDCVEHRRLTTRLRHPAAPGSVARLPRRACPSLRTDTERNTVTEPIVYPR
jgi:CRP-like cAMP-binding protein